MRKLFTLFLLTAGYLLLAFFNPVLAVDAPAVSGCSANMTTYIGCPSGTCPNVTATAKGDTYSHECTVVNHVEWVNENTFKQYSNDIHFLYQKTDLGISFLQDTIWGNMNCDNGDDAIYRVYQPGGIWGAEQFGLNMTCGNTFNKPESYLKTYSKTAIKADDIIKIDGAGYADNLDLYSCNVTGQSGVNSGGATQLIYSGPAQCCDTTFETAVVMNTDGPGAGEVYVYCADRGLCAHYQSLNFADSENDPNTWGADTDLCRLTAGADKDEYYLYPITGINDQNPDSFYSDLVAQGYQSYCYVPTEELKGELTIEEDWIAYSDSLTVSDIEQKYDYSQAQSPLWRNYEKVKALAKGGLLGIPSLFDSLENYWGVRNVSEEDQFLKDISSAPIYSLITREDQCLQKKKLLEATNELCNKLENPASCALDRVIPAVTRSSTGYRASKTDSDGNITQEDSGYTFLKLLNDINSTGFNCQQFAKNDYPTAKAEELAKVLDNTPLYLDKAYRLGFLVVAAEIHDSSEADPPFNFLPFNFFNKYGKGPGETAFHDVRVVAFKLPDIGTNKNPSDSGYYQDALELTANSILEKSYIDEYQKQVEAEKALPRLTSSETDVIIPLQTDYYMRSDLVQALVNFVNNRTNRTTFYGPSIYNPNAETLCGFTGDDQAKIVDLPIDKPANDSDSYTITDQAGIYQDEIDRGSDKFDFTTDGGGNLIENLEEEHIFQAYPPKDDLQIEDISEDEEFIDQEALAATGNQSSWAFKFLSRFSLAASKRKEGERDPKIFTFIVIPQGYQLAAAEEALSGLIYTYTDKQKFLADKQEAPPFLKLQNTGLQFFSDTAKGQAHDPSDCIDDLDTIEDECQVDVTAQVKLQDGNRTIDLEPRILGGRLGYLTRKIQESLHQANTKMSNWLASLNSTEEYLLGLGSDKELAAEHENLICTYEGGYRIESKSLRNLIAQAADKYNVPVAILSILVGGENCKHANEATNICSKSDDFYSQNSLLDREVTYFYTNVNSNRVYFNNCPEASTSLSSAKFAGPFRLSEFYFPDNWPKVALDGDNPCSVHDNIYALANTIASKGAVNADSPEAMKKSLIRWTLGPATWTGGGSTGITCESLEIAQAKAPAEELTKEQIKAGAVDNYNCDIRIAGDLNGDGKPDCAIKEWIWAAEAYCCAVDKAFGDTPGSYCTTDPWLNDVTPVKAEACK